MAAVFCTCAWPAAAQQSVADALTFLVTNRSVDTGSVERDAAAAQATSDTISRALLANLASLPVTSTSGAFVYRLNPAIGTVERPTETLGPVFIDRALTSGTGAGSIGMSYQHLHFTALDGRNLGDGSLVTTANQFVDEKAPFDVDQLTLHLDADVATLYGNIGVGSRVDLSGAAPLVWLRMDGTRVNTYRGRQFTQATASAQAVGLADVIARAKYTLYHEDGDGVAAAVDVRLPTGREEDLLGTGSSAVKFSGIGSIERGPFAVHVNGGITFGGLAREFTYNAALEAAATAKTTIIGELLGRTIDSPGHIVQVAAANPAIAGVQTLRLSPDDSMLQILTFVPGVKWNLSSTWILAANVSIPLTNDGLTAPFTTFIGLDYALGNGR